MVDIEASQDEIRKSRYVLCNPYAHLDVDDDGNGVYSALPATERQRARKEKYDKQNPYMHEEILSPVKERASFSYENTRGLLSDVLLSKARKMSIANRARLLRETIWNRKIELYENPEELDPVDLLDPVNALNFLGITVEEVDGLGGDVKNGSEIEADALYDQNEKLVQLSARMPFQASRFTAAHELGHVMMHNHPMPHRDRDVNGAAAPKGGIEREANIFASEFLMPEKLIRNRFEQNFGKAPLFLTEEVMFALRKDSSLSPREAFGHKNKLTKLLASSSRFGSDEVIPLATQFRVSITAMAIRLEELSLVDLSDFKK